MPNRGSAILEATMPSFFVPSGKSTAWTYKRVWNEKLKRMIVVRDQEFDLNEFIQSCSNASDIAMLKERCIKLGEVPSVNPNLQFGVDEVMFPDDIHELNDTLRNAEAVFNSFPDEVKAAFGNDFKKYHASVFSGTSQNVIGQYQAEQRKKAAEKVAQKGEE